MTRTDLLDLVCRFYPQGFYPVDPGYDDTDERRRQIDAMRVGIAEFPKWKAMLGRLRTRGIGGVTDLSLSMLGGTYNSGYSGYVKVPERPALAFYVSILGPYYAVRHDGSNEDALALERAREILAREIEATYRYAHVPPEVGNLVVPDVVVDGAGMTATIDTCLLSNHWGRGLPSWM